MINIKFNEKSFSHGLDLIDLLQIWIPAGVARLGLNANASFSCSILLSEPEIKILVQMV